MNWISKFLRKTDAKPSAASNPASNPMPTPASRPAEDVESLRGLLAVARDEGERGQLAVRLGQALAARSLAPRGEDPAQVWVAAIGQAADKALAQTWLAELKAETALGEVAIRARMAEIRFAAVQRIETNSVLEHVAHASRDKDKRIYRHCADLLKLRRQVETSVRRVREISDELGGLLESAPLPLSRLLELKNELGGLEEAGEAHAACHGLMEQALTRVRQETEALRDLGAHQNAAMALAEECAGAPWPWTALIGDWRARFDSLSQARAGLAAWLAGQASARGLGESLSAIESRLAAFTTDDERVLACESFFAALEAGLPPEAEASALWAALAKPEHPEAREAMASRWQALSASLKPAAVSEPSPAPTPEQTPAPAPRPQPKLDHDVLRGQLDKLEQAIGAGHLIDADAAAKQIKAALAGKALHGALESRWHDLQAQVETLRGWARWGTEQAREKLIASAGELLLGERDVEELAVAIPALREEWKRLNAHAPASKAQWEHFDATLEKAYEPVAAHRAEQAARQAEARTAKEALCAEWEAAIAGDQADLKAVETLRAEMMKRWRAAPQAGFRDERALRKRFDALIVAIDKRLDEARTAEFARREQLILAAEALREQTDPRRAISEAKALQQNWNKQASPVRLKRGDEQKLWKRFRAACDVVFANLDAQRAEQAAEREKQAQSRQALVDAFAASLAGADANANANADANEIKRVMNQFRTDWDAARPGTREAADKLDALARNLQEQARRRLDALRQAKQRSRYELLAQKSALAERVEAAALAAEPIETVVAEATQAWKALPDLPGKTERILAKRLADASAITPELLAAGHAARESLLLDLEIALGLPSPATHAETRRERQLDRLQNRFGSGTAQQSEPEEMLARWYATPALPIPSSAPRIAAIVHLLAEQAASAGER
jgi:exonuclease SbcC